MQLELGFKIKKFGLEIHFKNFKNFSWARRSFFLLGNRGDFSLTAACLLTPRTKLYYNNESVTEYL